MDTFAKAVLRVLEVQEYNCFVDIPIPAFQSGCFSGQNQQQPRRCLSSC